MAVLEPSHSLLTVMTIERSQFVATIATYKERYLPTDNVSKERFRRGVS